MSGLTFVFVHGLSGWGRYDDAYRRMPYWGMRGGDLMEKLNALGYPCFAASVSPSGSAWDRACELYGQIAGTRVDYGLAHSRRHSHARFGRDFSSDSLIPSWDEDTRLVLLGHSFGGATVRMFVQLLAEGDSEEQAEGGDVSPLFRGGMEKRVHAVAALASPLNGTTAYDLFEDADFDPDKVKVPFWSRMTVRMMGLGLGATAKELPAEDRASFDMHVERALALNERMKTLPHVYWFSVPCSCTVKRPDGTWVPDLKMVEPLFAMRAFQIGAYAGKTKGGFVLDESWRENDGLVNTLSARAPLGAPQEDLDPEKVEPGVWNVFPVFAGDHMSVQGGMMRVCDVVDFYKELLELISRTKGQ